MPSLDVMHDSNISASFPYLDGAIKHGGFKLKTPCNPPKCWTFTPISGSGSLILCQILTSEYPQL